MQTDTQQAGAVYRNVGPVHSQEFEAMGHTVKVLMVEDSPSISPGETFALASDAPVFRLDHEPCSAYADDSPFHNPFGLWRLIAIAH